MPRLGRRKRAQELGRVDPVDGAGVGRLRDRPERRLVDLCAAERVRRDVAGGDRTVPQVLALTWLLAISPLRMPLLRMSLLRTLLSAICLLPIRSAAYELPPRATKTAIVAMTLA